MNKMRMNLCRRPSTCIAILLLLPFQLPSTQELALTVLARLQQCVRAGLAYESLYWLVYNSVTLIFHVARRLMSRAVIDEVHVVVIVHKSLAYFWKFLLLKFLFSTSSTNIEHVKYFQHK